MTIERKAFVAMDLKTFSDQPGQVEAIVAVSGNEDLGGDIVQPGAFTKFVNDVKGGIWHKWPTLLWNHGVELGLAAVTGKVTDMEELMPGDLALPEKLRSKGLGGLKIRAQYNLNTQPGREAWEHVKAGDVSDWSFMYESESEMDAKGRRLLKQIYPVYECSNVLIGMNPMTFTVAVKSLEGLLEVVESPLRVQAREIVEQVQAAILDPKSDVSSREDARFSLRDDDGSVKYPINDCSDVRDAWGLRGRSSIPKDKVESYVRRVATKLNCDGPWNDGKSIKPLREALNAEWLDDGHFMEKGGAVPVLAGTQAIHNEALTTGLKALNSLMQQELAEPTCEYDDVAWLSQIAASLVAWAKAEMADVAMPTPAPAPAAEPSSGVPAGTTSSTGNSSDLPATDDVPALDDPPAMRILDPFNLSATIPVETKKGDDFDLNLDLDYEKIVAYLRTELTEFQFEIPPPEPIVVSDPVLVDAKDNHDGLTAFARRRVRARSAE